MSRPFDLDPLFRRLTALPGVGPKNAALFERLCGGEKVLDVLFHLPIDFIDRRFAPKISLLSVLYKTLSSSDVQTLSLSWEKQPKKVPLCQLVKQPTPRKICRSFSLYRLSFQLKVRDHIALLKTLSSLAQHSRADRVLALRLNPSGFPDRARYSIILQAHLELLSPLQAPSPKHPFLSLPAHDKRPNPFLPIYP